MLISPLALLFLVGGVFSLSVLAYHAYKRKQKKDEERRKHIEGLDKDKTQLSISTFHSINHL